MVMTILKLIAYLILIIVFIAMIAGEIYTLLSKKQSKTDKVMSAVSLLVMTSMIIVMI